MAKVILRNGVYQGDDADELSMPAVVLYLMMIIPWVFGIAIALSKGFWLTVLTIFVPPAAWVVLAQRIMEGCS